ncbi:RNA polymerase sigma factor [Flavihumibacter sp. UBA7668]|uniref:RNA polymerase sigma factor n=1 Tax=Flavihumibacter sp. UBA7668 TaxID=1946542 RepID=UPI0025B8FF87|nr:sigma-70 family RNA polymerase sigma factor [Flavihumibacter sp. UBA7668]
MTTAITYQEPELVALLRQKEETAYRYLYDHYAGALNGVILQIIPDQALASDVLQEVFLNIWRRIETYDSTKGRLFTWMLNIARNAAIDMTRSKAYQNNQKNRELDSNVDRNVDGTTNSQIDHIGLSKVIGQLKEEHRVLIDLSYLKGYTHDEIATLLQIPLGTVKTRIRAALLQLRKLLT